MFDRIQSEIRGRLGPEAAALRRYRGEFERDLARRWRVSTPDELKKALAAHSLVMIGDFHALQQSHKAHLRLLQMIDPKRELVLAVECFRRQDQKLVDDWMAGKLSETDFLKKVNWHRDWGFPWEHYRGLFEWARRRKVSVVALDGREVGFATRDRQVAKRLATLRKENENRQIIVIFGDLHLAAAHLPSQLDQAGLDLDDVLRVFLNPDEPYFRLMRKGLDHTVDVIRWDRHSFGVMSVPPWVKWQNYLLWMELAEEAEFGDGGLIDGTDRVAQYVHWIAEELELHIDESQLTVYSADDPDLWTRVTKSASADERQWIKMMIEDRRSFYLSGAGWGFLARPSVNHASALAMQFVHDQVCGGTHMGFRMPRDFSRMVWLEAWAYFGSKLVNPKRKTDTLRDLQTSLSSQLGDDRGREALRLALSYRMRELATLNGREEQPLMTVPKRRSSWIAATHLLGPLMGERIYNAYRKRWLKPELLRTFLAKEVKDPRFPLMYREMIEIIETWPMPFKSKREKL